MTKNLKNYTPESDLVYMSDKMMEYFYNKLVNWKKSLLRSEQSSLNNLADVAARENDPLDNSTNQEINYPQVACIKHKKMLIQQIDAALSNISNGSYGFCEHTGNPIGVGRLQSYPIARLSVWAQKQLENTARFTKMRSAY